MDLQLDTEQTILRDGVDRYLKDNYDYRTFRENAKSDLGWSAAIWREFAELGWLGLPFSSEHGGVGAGPVEISILMEAFGRHLVLEPYLSTVILSGGVISRLGTEAQRQDLLPQIAEGRQISFANIDSAGETTARKTKAGYVLNGRKAMVLGGGSADYFLVSAEIQGGEKGVFLVPATARGLAVRPFKMADERRAADLDLSDVDVPLSSRLGQEEDALRRIELAILGSIGALCADAVGAMRVVVDATVEYTKTRVQFGQPIGKFQALQHRMVDMGVRAEEARATALFATLSLAQSSTEMERAVYGAKAKIGRCGRSIYQNAIQLHGAIGTTDELSLGSYAKRLMAFEVLFGTTREHLRKYSSIISMPDVAARGLLSHSSL